MCGGQFWQQMYIRITSTGCCSGACWLQGVGKAADAALLEAVNVTGKTFIIHTEVGGKYMLRFALGGTNVQRQHVEGAWRVITSKVDAVLSQEANLP